MLREVFHVAGAALVDSENKVQVQRFLEIIMHYSNAAISILKEAGDLNELENLEELVADKPLTIDFGASDNSDAIQAAFEAVGAEPVNCKVHIKRNMARQKLNGGKEELKAVGRHRQRRCDRDRAAAALHREAQGVPAAGNPLWLLFVVVGRYDKQRIRYASGMWLPVEYGAPLPNPPPARTLRGCVAVRLRGCAL